MRVVLQGLGNVLRLTAAVLVVGAIPTATLAEGSKDIFLTCDVFTNYKDDNRTVRETIHFKIVPKEPIIFRFSPDFGRYSQVCGKGAVFDKGDCFGGEVQFSYNTIASLFGTTKVESMTFYRASGKISGAYTIYKGRFNDINDTLAAEPVRQTELEGVCRQGQDMSTIRKAF